MLIRVLHLCSQSNVAASNAKLALFYDWFFFDVEKDSIMNIGTQLGGSLLPVQIPLDTY